MSVRSALARTILEVTAISTVLSGCVATHSISLSKASKSAESEESLSDADSTLGDYQYEPIASDGDEPFVAVTSDEHAAATEEIDDESAPTLRDAMESRDIDTITRLQSEAVDAFLVKQASDSQATATVAGSEDTASERGPVMPHNPIRNADSTESDPSPASPAYEVSANRAEAPAQPAPSPSLRITDSSPPPDLNRRPDNLVRTAEFLADSVHQHVVQPDAPAVSRTSGLIESPQPLSADVSALPVYGEDADPPGRWRTEHLPQAIGALQRELDQMDGNQPERARLETILRLLNLAGGRWNEALQPIEAIEGEERDYWRDQLHTLLIALDNEGIPVPSKRATLMLRHLRDAERHLASVSELDVRNLAFCHVVESYGLLKKFSGYRFKPNQEVLLYVEVDNMAAEETPGGFETELRGSYQVFNAQSNHRVADIELPLDRQTCANRRRDYFIPYRIYLPKSISPGTYTLQLTMEDVKGGKFGQASLDFDIR